jgi:hypothetical protein
VTTPIRTVISGPGLTGILGNRDFRSPVDSTEIQIPDLRAGDLAFTRLTRRLRPDASCREGSLRGCSSNFKTAMEP